MPLRNNCRALRTSLSKVWEPLIWNVLLKGPIPSPSGRHDWYIRTQVLYKTIVWNVGPTDFAPTRLSVAPVRQRRPSTFGCFRISFVLQRTFATSSRVRVCNRINRTYVSLRNHGMEIVRFIIIELKLWKSSAPSAPHHVLGLLGIQFLDRVPVPGRLTAVVLSVPVWFTSAFARLACSFPATGDCTVPSTRVYRPFLFPHAGRLADARYFRPA